MIEQLDPCVPIQIPVKGPDGQPLIENYVDEEGNPVIDEDTGNPIRRHYVRNMIAVERVLRDCGCAFYIGFDPETQGPSTCSIPCGAEHLELTLEWEANVAEWLDPEATENPAEIVEEHMP